MTPEQAKQLQERGLDFLWLSERGFHDFEYVGIADDKSIIAPNVLHCMAWLDEYAPGWSYSSPDPNSVDPLYSKHYVYVQPARCFPAPTRLEALRLAVLATEKEE